MNQYILAIETSCDETSCSVLKNGSIILSNIISSQIKEHQKFGGVVPEIASRLHVEKISIIIKNAIKLANINIKDIDVIAYTKGPGLIGALHIGNVAAKTLALALNKPLIGVNHLIGHIYSTEFTKEMKFPALSLIISGGHTLLILIKDHLDFEIIGETLDDAIGECYDKVGRFLNLDYPAGYNVDLLACKGNDIYKFSEPKTKNELDFSFSGLKTNVINFINKKRQNNEEFLIEDICASFQKTAMNLIIKKVIAACDKYSVEQILISGGVSANSYLRNQITKEISNIEIIFPPLELCGDNAAMIAKAAYYYFKKNIIDKDLNSKSLSNYLINDFNS